MRPGRGPPTTGHLHSTASRKGRTKRPFRRFSGRREFSCRAADNPAEVRTTKRIAIAAVLIAATAAIASARPERAPARPASPSVAPMLGINWGAGARLAWFEPITLRALPGRKAPLGYHQGSWSFSADRGVFAIGSWDAPELRFINVRSMRLLGDLLLAKGPGAVEAVAWVAPRRVLALVTNDEATKLVVIDPLARRVLRRIPLPARLWEVARLPNGLVLLLGPYDRFASAQLALVDENGGLRVIPVAGIQIGSVVEDEEDHLVRSIRPALAVAAEAGRAYVIGTDREVAEIDLSIAGVLYHRVGASTASPDASFAKTKSLSGPERWARYLGNGLIALTGADYSTWKDENGKRQMRTAPFGLRLVDVDGWTERTLNARASGLMPAGRLLFAQGGSWDSATEKRDSVGLVAYGLDGRERYRLYEDRPVWLWIAGGLGYVSRENEQLTDVVDLASGTILNTIEHHSNQPLPMLLGGAASGDPV
jgi:hypothetical protein